MCACVAGIEVYGNTVSDEAVTRDEFVYDPIVPPSSQGKRKEAQKQQAQIRNCSITVVAAGKVCRCVPDRVFMNVVCMQLTLCVWCV